MWLWQNDSAFYGYKLLFSTIHIHRNSEFFHSTPLGLQKENIHPEFESYVLLSAMEENY